MMVSSLSPIEANKKTIAAIVQDRIREAILSSELSPGSRVDQVRLAKMLDVSLVPVREALKMLEGEGFVKIIPRRGAFVTSVSIRDMEDLYFTRQILEGEAAFHAAANLTDADLETLAVLVSKMEDVLQNQDFATFSELNRQFHFTIYRAAKSYHTVNTIVSLWDLSERYRYRYMYIHDYGQAIKHEHRAILEACQARDGVLVRKMINFHMHQTMKGIEQYLRSKGHEAAPGSDSGEHI